MKISDRILAVSFFMIMGVMFASMVETVSAMDSASENQPPFKTAHKEYTWVRLEAITPDGKTSNTGSVSYTGTCPATIKFRGVITSPTAGDVSYTFSRSDGGKLKPVKLHFDKPGVKTVETSWKLSKSFAGWITLDLSNHPAGKSSAKAEFALECSGDDRQTSNSKALENITAQKEQIKVDEECTSFNPNRSIFKENRSIRMLEFYDTDTNKNIFSMNLTFAPYSEKALNLIRGYGFNQTCSAKPRGYMPPYFLVSGEAPTGQQSGEKCTSFDASKLVTRKWSGVWQVYDGHQVLFQFDRFEEAAKNGIAIVKKYGFTQTCNFGDVSPNLRYFKR